MSYRCARCDWRGDTDDEATEHARESQHLRCIVCQRRSLTEFEPQTCPPCVARVRSMLAELVDAYALLAPTTTEALTLLGDGTMQRLYRDDEWLHGYRDEWASDPLPVVAALASWEDFWRERFGDGAGGKATLAGVTGYLLARLDRAAQFHPAFDEFAAELRRHRAAVHAAVGLSDVPVPADAPCFDCGGDLLRTYRALAEPVPARRARARRAVHRLLEPTMRQRAAERSYAVRDLTPWPTERVRELWRRLAGGVAGEGLTDEWTCDGCGQVYDETSYLARLRSASALWVPATVAAKTAHRSVRTVRSWVNRGHVSAACRVADRAVLVWWPDVSDRAFRSTEERTEHAS